MTPCEEKGYKVGQVFKDPSDREWLVLERDDGTTRPYFFSIKDEYGNTPRCIRDLVRIYPPEEESKEVEVECEGKKTTISRESAKALNLI